MKTMFFHCVKPLGAGDYLAIGREFDTVFIRDIPQMSLTMKTAARRFITLVDNFYDNKVINITNFFINNLD